MALGGASMIVGTRGVRLEARCRISSNHPFGRTASYSAIVRCARISAVDLGSDAVGDDEGRDRRLRARRPRHRDPARARARRPRDVRAGGRAGLALGAGGEAARGPAARARRDPRVHGPARPGGDGLADRGVRRALLPGLDEPDDDARGRRALPRGRRGEHRDRRRRPHGAGARAGHAAPGAGGRAARRRAVRRPHALDGRALGAGPPPRRPAGARRADRLRRPRRSRTGW